MSEVATRGGGRGTLLVLGALLAGLIGGIAITRMGGGWREPAIELAATVGGMWLDGLRMTVIPLIVTLLITGLVGGSDAARSGGVAGRSVLWFAIVLTCSAVFGAVAMPWLIGWFPLPAEAADALRAGLASVDAGAAAAAVPTVHDFLRSIIPQNPIAAAAADRILQLVVFTLAFAVAVTRLDRQRRMMIFSFFEAAGEALLIVIRWVLWLAPVGVFALAFAVGAGAGGAALGGLIHYVLLVSALGLLILLAGYGVAMAGARWRLGTFARAMIAPQAVAISTQSSLASLPAMLQAAQRLGVPERSADVTLPLAVALMRATGPAMNMGVAIYVAHWLGIELGFWQVVAGVLVAAVTTYGTVSLPGQVSFVTSIAPICLAMGLPVEPLALLIAVETIPDMFRTVGNVTMDVAVTGAVARGSQSAGEGERATVGDRSGGEKLQRINPVTDDRKPDASIHPSAQPRPPEPELERKLKKNPDDLNAKADVGSDESMDASDPSAAAQPGNINEPVPSSGYPKKNNPRK